MPRPVLALLLLWVSGAAFAAESTAPWRELLLERTELAESANALVRLRPLYDTWTPPDPRLAEELTALSSPVSAASPGPGLLAWLGNATDSIAQARFNPGEFIQLPRIHGPETPFPDHQSLRQLATARLALIKTCWFAGESTAALDLALENLALSRALLVSQEGIVPLLNATRIWQLSLDGIYWLARQPDLTASQATRLQLALLRDERLASDALVRAFRGEFTFFTHLVVERLPRTRDVELLLSGISSLGMAPPVPPADGEPRLSIPPAGREPFDREATLQSAAADVRGWTSAFAATDRHPRDLNDRHTRRHLQAHAAEIPALLRYASDDTPVTHAQIATIDAEIASIENPVGKLFLIITTSNWEPLSVHVYRREAQSRALTGLLAWRRFGKPAAWKDLVTAGLLPAAPADPFSNQSLRLELTPPRIWSLGANGIDDGGAGDGDNVGRPADFTWPAGL